MSEAKFETITGESWRRSLPKARARRGEAPHRIFRQLLVITLRRRLGTLKSK